MFSAQTDQICSGLAVMGFALLTMLNGFFEKYDQICEIRRLLFAIVRAMQLLATLALIVGITKAPKRHKSTFLLFWLILTTILLFQWILIAMMIPPDEILNTKGLPYLVLGSIVGFIACMMWIIYKNYVELTKGNEGADRVA